LDGAQDELGTAINFAVEYCGDVQAALSMAPGAMVRIYTSGSNRLSAVLHKMATTQPLSMTNSSSLSEGEDLTARQAFQELAAQGQSFFDASGDEGGYTTDVTTADTGCTGGLCINNSNTPDMLEDPYVTVVGGTTFTSSLDKSSEVTWECGGGGYFGK